MRKAVSILLVFLVLLIPLTATACFDSGTEEKADAQTYTPDSIVGTFVYEYYEGSLSYDIIRDVYVFNADGTYSNDMEWRSTVTSMSTEGRSSGTWTVEGNKVIMTNESGFKEYLTITNGKLTRAATSDGEESATVYFKKEG